MRNAVTLVHAMLRQHIQPGDVVVDATAGNGYDAQMMATRVGDHGVVYAFDVQEAAIDATRRLLEACDADVRVVHDGHQHMATHVEPRHHGRVRAVTFNLGYLPGHDHTCTTQAETTLEAIHAGMRLMAPGGLMTLVCYRHPEGERELAAIRAFAATLPQRDWIVTETQFPNMRGTPPIVITLFRLPDREQLAS